LPIIVGRESIGILENWNTGRMGSDKKKEKGFVISQYSIIPSFQNYFIIELRVLCHRD